jgi:hypothetical protein
VPVTLVGTSVASAKRSTMEVVLASGHVVRVGTDFDAEALVKLVRVLERGRAGSSARARH